MNTGLYGYSTSGTASAIRSINGVAAPVSIAVLVIGSGGSGGGAQGANTACGGGGAGGLYETASLMVALNTAYTVQIGAGGASPGAVYTGNVGNYSRFGDIIMQGGGAGAYNSGQTNFSRNAGVCSGGANNGTGIAAAFFGGFAGASGVTTAVAASGGGGGTGGAGVAGTSGVAGAGGAGTVSAITGETLAGGGGGGLLANGSGGSGNGGGGNGGSNDAGAANGTANSGGGGGGSGYGSTTATRSGGAGGSGRVVLQFNIGLIATLSAGLTHSSTYSGSLRTLTITAGTGTITFS